ncbi:MAG TPA: OmpA family protein [Candidatus Latescibacteria bacterium]|nr:OmpA family protein [Candidatus Latescibacterota bacterium]
MFSRLRQRVYLLVAAMCVAATSVYAVTPPGTLITSQASLTYFDNGGFQFSLLSNTVVTPVLGSVVGTDGTISQTTQIVAGENITVLLTDPDRNYLPNAIDTVHVTVTNPRTGEVETLVLYETGQGTGVFSGSLPTYYGQSAGPDHDGTLFAQPGDVLQISYNDNATSAGGTAVVTGQTTVLPTWIKLTPEPRTIVANGTDQSRLTARVTDDLDRPLPDGTIVVFTADKGKFSNDTQRIEVPVSGGNGEAVTILTAPILAANDTARVVASFRGFDSDVIKLIILPGAVAVRVYDQTRNVEVRANDPALRVEVELVGTTVTGDPISIFVELDENGVFVVPDIPPGTYQLHVHVTDRVTGADVMVGVLQTIVVNMDGSTSPPRNAVAGMVHARNEESGARYAGLTVELLDANGNVVATTVLDAMGRYDFQNLLPGAYSLRVKMEDGDVFTVPVSSRTNNLGEVVLNADVLIDPFGRVFDAVTTALIPGSTVTLRNLDERVLAIPLLNGTGVPPNVNNINPFVTPADGRYAFLFSSSQVGTVANPARYIMTVDPPSGTTYPPRRMHLTVRPTADGSATIMMTVSSGDGLQIARPNSFGLTNGPVTVPDIETVAYNIPMFPKTPVLKFSKLASTDTTSYGETVDFAIVVVNVGNDVAPSVTVTDTLNSGWTLVSSDATTSNGGVLTWNVGDLQPGASDTLHVRAEAADQGVILTNAAWAQFTGGLPVSSQADVVSRSASSISITKAVVTPPALVGKEIHYEIRLKTPPGYAGKIAVEDPLPAELVYIAGSSVPAATYDAGTHTLTWQVSGATSDTVRTFTFATEPRGDLTPGDYPIPNTATASVGAFKISSNRADDLVTVPYFRITKTSDITAAEPGDFVVYRIALENLSTADSLSNIVVRDVMPFGFEYVPNTARLDGVAAPPDTLRDRNIIWNVAGIGAGKTRLLTYRLVLGIGAGAGDGQNTATATASTSRGATLSAGPATARVFVQPALFTQDQVVLGRAWVDLNGNKVHDDGEPPVPGVVLLMEDGTRVIADRMGRFSIPEIRTGDHAIRLLEHNIPDSLEPVILGVRSTNDPWMRFVSVSASGMAKANFPFRVKPRPPAPPPPPPPPPPPALAPPESLTVAVTVERVIVPDSITIPASETIILESGVTFATGKADLRPEGIAVLNDLLPRIKRAQGRQITVSGHTDPRPIRTRQFPNNMVLSLARARTVRNWMVQNGVDSTHIAIFGYGPDRPIAPNTTPEGMQKNRRVEINLDYGTEARTIPAGTARVRLAIRTSGNAERDTFTISQPLPEDITRPAPDSLRDRIVQHGDSVWAKIARERGVFTDLPAPEVSHRTWGSIPLRRTSEQSDGTIRETWDGSIRVPAAVDSSTSLIPQDGAVRTVQAPSVAPAGGGSVSPSVSVPAAAGQPPALPGAGAQPAAASTVADSISPAQAPAVELRRLPTPKERVQRPGQLVWIEYPTADSTVSYRDRLTLTARGQTGMPMTLRLNGREVSTLSVRGDSRVDFLNIAAPSGPVTLTVTQTFPGGRVFADSIFIHVVGPAARVMLDVSPSTLPADSLSQAEAIAQVLDEWGMPLADGQVVTFEIDNGSIITPDLYPEERGVQVQMRGGYASALILSSAKPGEATLTANASNIVARATLNYTVPHERFVLVGIASGQIGWKTNAAPPAGVNFGKDFNSGAYGKGKAAFFGRGTVRNGYLLTTSFDSDRRFDDQVYRYLTPERAYPIHGDASSIFYEAPSASKFFFRLAKERNYLQYGDFAPDLSQAELTAYRRTFTGVAAAMRNRHTAWSLFGAFTEQAIQVDEIPGEGVSGNYYLSAARRGVRVVEGSERIVIQTRDRIHPENILREEVQYRFVDYEIDYLAGTILFKKPIPSRGFDENPIFIVATYEASRALQRHTVGGGRFALHSGDRWEVGTSLVGEGRSTGDYWLSGIDAGYRPFQNVFVNAELARSDLAQTGWAWKFGAQGRYRSTLNYDLSYRSAERAFYNPSSTSALPGVTKMRGKVTWSPVAFASLTGEAFRSDDVVNREVRNSAALGGTYRWRTLTGLASTEITNVDRAGQETRTGVVSTGLEWAASRTLTFKAERDQNFLDEDVTYRPTLNRLQARWSPLARLDVIAEHAFRDYNFVDSSYTAIGLQSRVTDNTTAYANYKLDGGINGQKNEAIVGLRHRFMPFPYVSMSTGFERMQTLRGNRSADFYSYSIAGEYLPPELFKASARFEQREGQTLDKMVVSGAFDVVLARNLSLLAKHTYAGEATFATGTWNRLRSHHFLSGLAWRSDRSDYLNVLGKYEYKKQYNGMLTPATDRSVHIGSLEGMLEPRSQLEVFGRYAFKVAQLSSEGVSSRSLTDLWMGSIRYELRETWDVLGEYRLISQHTANDLQHGASAEVGRVLGGNARIALGYNFVGYHDSDFAGLSYWGQGPFMRIQVKFTEREVAGALDGLQTFWRGR